MANLSCGPTGSTGQEIVNEINRINSASISKIGGVNGTSQTVTDTISTMLAGSYNDDHRGDGLIADFTAGTITAVRDMTIFINYTIYASWTNNDEIEFSGLKNGAPIPTSGELLPVIGRGTKPVNFSYFNIVNLLAGDVVSLGCRTLIGTSSITWRSCSIIASEIM